MLISGMLIFCSSPNMKVLQVLAKIMAASAHMLTKAWFTLATETEAEMEMEAQISIQTSVKRRRNKREENRRVCFLLFCLCFAGFVWNFMLPSSLPSPLLV